MTQVFCCSCGDEIVNDIHARLLEVDYTVPTDEPMTVHAVCCGACALQYESEAGKQVITMMVSTRLARVRLPDKEWKEND